MAKYQIGDIVTIRPDLDYMMGIVPGMIKYAGHKSIINYVFTPQDAAVVPVYGVSDNPFIWAEYMFVDNNDFVKISSKSLSEFL